MRYSLEIMAKYTACMHTHNTALYVQYFTLQYINNCVYNYTYMFVQVIYVYYLCRKPPNILNRTISASIDKCVHLIQHICNHKECA